MDEGAPGERVLLLAAALQDPGQVAEGVDQHERGLDRRRAEAAPPGRRSDGGEQALTARDDAVELPRRGGRVGVAGSALDVEDEPPQAGARDAAAEPAGRRLFETVSLVEDDCVVLGQHTAAGGDVGEVQGVVHDHELGLGGAAAGRLREARGHERAAPSRAAVGADGQLGPERRRRLEFELGAVAGLGGAEPGLHRLPGGPVAAAGIELGLEALELPAAEVVLPALEQLDPHRPSGDGSRDRDVRAQQLLLQRLGGGRDDDAQPGGERGHEVGEALADAGARLGDQVVAARERVLDRGRERGLLRTGLIARQRAGEGAAGAEHVVHCQTASLRVRTDVPPRGFRLDTNLRANCDIQPGGALTAAVGPG